MNNSENFLQFIKFREGGMISASSIEELLSIDNSTSLENTFKYDELEKRYKPLND